MMGLFTAIRFDRSVPMQASSLARLPTLLALWAGRAFLETATHLWHLGADRAFTLR